MESAAGWFIIESVAKAERFKWLALFGSLV